VWLELADSTGTVFTSRGSYDWLGLFDRLQLATDPEDGGYCAWDSTAQAVRFRSDRGSSYIEGWIDDVLVMNQYEPNEYWHCSYGPVSVQNSTWGRLKAVYRK